MEDADAGDIDWGLIDLSNEEEDGLKQSFLEDEEDEEYDISWLTFCRAEAAIAAEVKNSNWLNSGPSNDFWSVSRLFRSINEGEGYSSTSKASKEPSRFNAFVLESSLCVLEDCEETDKLADKLCSGEEDIWKVLKKLNISLLRIWQDNWQLKNRLKNWERKAKIDDYSMWAQQKIAI